MGTNIVTQMVQKYKWKRKQYILTNYSGSAMELLLFHAVTTSAFVFCKTFLNLKVYKRRIKAIVLVPKFDI